VLRPVERGLTETAARWPSIAAAYARVFRATQILNNDGQAPAAAVRWRYRQLLIGMQDTTADPGTDPTVTGWYATFLKVTASYGDTIFRCYDHPELGLPRTNNDLEQLFGSVRYHERRASGRKQVAPTLLLRGRARVLAGVSTRLRTYRAADLPRPISPGGARYAGSWRRGKRRVGSSGASGSALTPICTPWKHAANSQHAGHAKNTKNAKNEREARSMRRQGR
jgi:hypothetical protein